MRESYTAVVERNVDISGEWATEPYECAWATEAIYFVRPLSANGSGAITLRAQISPDGMRWVDSGAEGELASGVELAALRVAHFGGWLRLVGQVPDGGSARVIVYLNLK